MTTQTTKPVASDDTISKKEVEAYHKAAAKGKLAAVKAFVEKHGVANIDIHKDERADYTALAEAVSNGHLDVARYLLENKADANHIYYFDRPITALSDTVAMTELLCKHGAKLDARFAGGKNLLIWLGTDNPELSVWYMQHGVFPNDRCDRNMNFPMHLVDSLWNAKENDRINAVKLIEYVGRHYGHLDEQGRWNAASNNSVAETEGYTVAMMAAERGYDDVLEKCISLKVDFSKVNAKGQDALYIAKNHKQRYQEEWDDMRQDWWGSYVADRKPAHDKCAALIKDAPKQFKEDVAAEKKELQDIGFVKTTVMRRKVML